MTWIPFAIILAMWTLIAWMSFQNASDSDKRWKERKEKRKKK